MENVPAQPFSELTELARLAEIAQQEDREGLLAGVRIAINEDFQPFVRRLGVHPRVR